MFERWTSTTGSPAATRSASRSATLVWVRPPGLIEDAVRGAARALDPVDQLAFVVRLEGAELRPRRLGLRRERRVDLGEGGPAVDLGLAGPEEVQVRPVHDEDAQRRPWAQARRRTLAERLRAELSQPQVAAHQEARLAEVAVRREHERPGRSRRRPARSSTQKRAMRRHASSTAPPPRESAALRASSRMRPNSTPRAAISSPTRVRRRRQPAGSASPPPARSRCRRSPSAPRRCRRRTRPRSSAAPTRSSSRISPQVLEPALEGGDHALARASPSGETLVAARRASARAGAPRPRRRGPAARAARPRCASRRASPGRRERVLVGQRVQHALGLVEVRGAHARARPRSFASTHLAERRSRRSAKAPSISPSSSASRRSAPRPSPRARARRARAGGPARRSSARSSSRLRLVDAAEVEERERERDAARRRARADGAGPPARRARPPPAARRGGSPRRAPGRPARRDRRRAGPRGARSRRSLRLRVQGAPPLPSSPRARRPAFAPRAAAGQDLLGQQRHRVRLADPPQHHEPDARVLPLLIDAQRREISPAREGRELGREARPARGAPRAARPCPRGAIPSASERRAAKTMPIATASPCRTPR